MPTSASTQDEAPQSSSPSRACVREGKPVHGWSMAWRSCSSAPPAAAHSMKLALIVDVHVCAARTTISLNYAGRPDTEAWGESAGQPPGEHVATGEVLDCHQVDQAPSHRQRGDAGRPHLVRQFKGGAREQAREECVPRQARWPLAVSAAMRNTALRSSSARGQIPNEDITRPGIHRTRVQPTRRRTRASPISGDPYTVFQDAPNSGGTGGI